MKKDIHPKYYPESAVTCACGAKYQVGSTLEKFNVEICAACHPFYTGLDKVMDTAGRVERFKTRAAKTAPKAKKTKKPAKLESAEVAA